MLWALKNRYVETQKSRPYSNLFYKKLLIQTLSKCNVLSCLDNCGSCPELLKLKDDVAKLEDDNASLKEDVAKLKELGNLRVLSMIVILFRVMVL